MSAETLLLYLTETWKAALDTNRVVRVIFIDFKKAFDMVNHKILSYKLQAVRISGDLYSLLLSYLENRVQYVEINGKRSKLRFVKVGVPQGSNLGPQLFAICVNDFPEAIKIGELHMFANNTTVFVISESEDMVVDILANLVKDIEKWCSNNKLTIHQDKTEAMVITKKGFVGPMKQLKIGEGNIKFVEFSKCLGVCIDNKLSWGKQISAVCSSFNSKLCLIRKLSYLPTET